MKYIQTYHISCLYPHLLLTFIKVHTHEDIYSRIHTRGILPKSLILYELGIIIPSLLSTRTIVGIPAPSYFLVVANDHYFVVIFFVSYCISASLYVFFQAWNYTRMNKVRANMLNSCYRKLLLYN